MHLELRGTCSKAIITEMFGILLSLLSIFTVNFIHGNAVLLIYVDVYLTIYMCRSIVLKEITTYSILFVTVLKCMFPVCLKCMQVSK